MLGPEANHLILVSHADRLPLARRRLRRPDPAARRRAAHDRRRLPPPVAPDHAARLPPRADRAAARGVMEEEIERALGAVAATGRARPLRLDARAGAADRDARAVRASTPTARRGGLDPAREFERALGFYGARVLAAGPARAAHAVGARCRRARPARPPDLRARSRAAARTRRARRGRALAAARRATRTAAARDRHVRDEVMTLLFAGHDTTTATVAFLFYELAATPRSPTAIARHDLTAAARPGARRDAAALPAGLDRPAPRGRAVRVRRPSRSPAGAPVNYSSWASHRLPDVWEDAARVPPRALRARAARRASPRAPTSRSAAARGSASGCASASPRSRRSPPPSASVSASSCPAASASGSARRRRSARTTACRCGSGWRADRARTRFPSRRD